ncbi:hypothetical protein BHM03_00009772 [Ensete ventricosum]|nr:hypothetical protein BHM03_00009772 [Ensete ventricosum]
MDRNTITVSEGFLRCPWCEQGRKCFRYQESLLCGRFPCCKLLLLIFDHFTIVVCFL